MKLILVRHGESEANANHILQGQTEGKLTAKGIEQAKKTGKELKEKYKIDMVFCSPLGRCVETLNCILNEYQIEGEIFMSRLLMERDFGEYSEMETQLIDWEEMDKESKINDEMGVESLADLRERAKLFLEDLKLEEGVETVLVVSHSGPIKMMISILTGKELDEIEVKNSEINEFDLF